MKQFSQIFESLKGKQVHRWIGTEMALDQKSQPVVWTDDSINYLQLFDLDIHLSDDSIEQIVSRLDDDGNYYGLYMEQTYSSLDLFDAQDTDILRRRNLSELPVGVIDRVACDIDKYKQITTLTIYIAKSVIKLLSGAIDRADGQFSVIAPEEFILIEVEAV